MEPEFKNRETHYFDKQTKPQTFNNPKFDVKKHYTYFKYVTGEGKLLAEIWYNIFTRDVKVINHTNNVHIKPFGIKENPTFKDLEVFLESRCFPQARANCKEILNELGMPTYDPFEIVRVNGGNCHEDNFYIEFCKSPDNYDITLK